VSQARFFVDLPLASQTPLSLPDQAARHAQVLRLQPGSEIALFNGDAAQPEGEFSATVTRMGRSEVEVMVGQFVATQRERLRAIHLLVGVPANERMDWLVEKAAELGAASITPLMTERSVLRLKGERADKKRAHWQAVANAACEQSGRCRLTAIHPVSSLAEVFARPEPASQRLVLSLQGGARPLPELLAANSPSMSFLSGPEGGLSPLEEAAAARAGFVAATLGPRVLRAETAPLAVLASLLLN
jgi:16S rRNA (uracil1498-N3)-methyltransferase